MGQKNSLRIAVVIPARFASTRFPGKPLADLCGKSLIQRVWEGVRGFEADRVLVATDDDRIADAVRRFGGEVVMTSGACASGTDRVAEAAKEIVAEIVINVQGDEPFVEPSSLQALAAAFRDPEVEMATLSRSATPDELANPNVVKVVTDIRGDALYFSRQAIPFARNGTPPKVFAHVGVYAYRASFLQDLSAMAPTPLEKAEALEQLRVLEHGHRIRVVPTGYTGFGIDTPEDLERARSLLSRKA
jgi:3-deoxy-manno-octulosonate cytidylyltransferase (CMP-KDO synthetase)